MADQTHIQWTDASWNPVVGCSKVSEGCRHCYAMTMAARIANAARATVGIGGRVTERQAGYALAVQWDGDKALPQWSNAVLTLPSALAEPLSWRRPRRVFVNSMSDLFHEAVPFEFIDRVFAVMALCPQHTFQVLTKRPERMAEYLTTPGRDVSVHGTKGAMLRLVERYEEAACVAARHRPWPLSNVWIGVSTEDQATLDERVPHLLRCSAAVRFLSLEPLLGPIDLIEARAIIENACGCLDEEGRTPCANCNDSGCVACIDWVIAGGESGPNARPCNARWIASIVEQCKAAGVPCFVKQLGAKPYVETDATVRDWPSGVVETVRSGARVSIQLPSRKGDDPAEWPEHLRVREWPKFKP